MKQIAKNVNMEEVLLSQVREMIKDYDYVIAHMISSLEYGTPEQMKLNWEELIELRAFHLSEELHVFFDGENQKAVRILETDGEKDEIVKTYPMKNGKFLRVKEYLTPDEDGQAVVACTRPFAVVSDLNAEE